MKDIVEKILSSAVLAPSGDNTQPWRFVVRGDGIRVFHLPKRDLTLYDFKRRGGYLAHGAMIENMIIAASDYGHSVRCDLFPDKLNPLHVATASLEKTAPEPDPLFAFIPHRSTNRRPYRTEPLKMVLKKELMAVAGEIGYGEIRLIDEPEKVKILAKAISLNERLILENKYIHDVLFSHITWSEEEAMEKRTGLYVKTLELKPPEEAAFRLFKNWRLLKLLNRVGVSRLLPRQSAKLYASSAAIGAVLIKGDSNEEYVHAGRVFQRLWLKATKMGLSLSPVTGVAYLGKRIADGDVDKLPSLHVELIKDAYREITRAFGLSNEAMAMVFRIGYGEKPTATSFKLPPNIIFEE